MADQLESSKSCVQHAVKRIRELEAEIAAFSTPGPYVEVVEDDPEPSWKVRKVRVTKTIPLAFSHIAFDAVSPLRAALDQAGYAVVKASGGNVKKAHFPFGDSLIEAESRKNNGAKDIPRQIFDLMVSFQPYLGGNNSLWGLNKLCNSNKHEVTLAPVIRPGQVQVQRGTVVGPASVSNLWDGEKRELTLARVGPGGSVANNFTYSFSILIGDVLHVEGKPVISYLDNMAAEIDSILTAIESEALNMGIFI